MKLPNQVADTFLNHSNGYGYLMLARTVLSDPDTTGPVVEKLLTLISKNSPARFRQIQTAILATIEPPYKTKNLGTILQILDKYKFDLTPLITNLISQSTTGARIDRTIKAALVLKTYDSDRLFSIYKATARKQALTGTNLTALIDYLTKTTCIFSQDQKQKLLTIIRINNDTWRKSEEIIRLFKQALQHLYKNPNSPKARRLLCIDPITSALIYLKARRSNHSWAVPDAGTPDFTNTIAHLIKTLPNDQVTLTYLANTIEQVPKLIDFCNQLTVTKSPTVRTFTRNYLRRKKINPEFAKILLSSGALASSSLAFDFLTKQCNYSAHAAIYTLQGK